MSRERSGAPGRRTAGYPRQVPAKGHTVMGGAGMPAEVGLFVLVNVAPAARLAGYLRFLLGRFAMGRAPGMRFLKVMGSGQEGGFGLRPSPSHQGLVCAFEHDADADRFLAESPQLRAYREQAVDFLVVKVRATSSRGAWDGREPFALTGRLRPGQPVAALTRASIRPAAVARFWRHSPPSERSLVLAAGCRLAVGLGEAPVLRQATFSIWDDQAAMDAYARQGAHLDAIRAAAAGGFFSESLFCRFEPVWAMGAWQGRSAADILAPAASRPVMFEPEPVSAAGARA